MHVFARVLPAASAIAGAFLLAGCGGSANPAIVTSTANELSPAQTLHPSLSQPMLIAFQPNGSLGYWPIRHGGSKLRSISGALGVEASSGMAANGNVVIVASYLPAKIVRYNVKTTAVTTMADPYGNPEDVAVGKNGTIYAMNETNVAVYKPKSKQPSQLTCAYVDQSEAIAVDNEGDVFVDGYGPGSFQGVVEYAKGSTKCAPLHLRPSQGYIGGVGVDPKTDDLIVIDDPDECAGGEGRMIIYRKPYEREHSIRHDLQTTYCAGALRLDAGSKHIFYGDATVSDGFRLVDQAQYPSGKYDGDYQNIASSGYGNFSAFTTIPNTLPN